ncbi:hypothetical protein BASA81_002575 [Batrachochytrium salamandrivorans]|nr:hypothetical protein BASA81_002575 [Batrachochytrium salamandrivorans]
MPEHEHEQEHHPAVATSVISAADILPPLDTLKCTLCREFFNEPITLNCMHSFCTACLLKEHGADTGDLNQFLDSVAPQEPTEEEDVPGEDSGKPKSKPTAAPAKRTLQCPTCIHALHLDAGLLEQAEPFPNARLSRIVSLVLGSHVLCENCKNSQSEKLCSVCNVHLCSPCWDKTHGARIFANHLAKPLLHKEMTALPKCPHHVLNEQEFFVTEEETGACQVCLLKGSFVGAQYSLVSDVRQERQVEIDNLLQDVAFARSRLAEGKEDIEAVLQDLTVSHLESKNAVVENFKLIREALDSREKETIEALDVLLQAKRQVLQNQVSECEILIHQIDDGVDNVELVLKHSNPLEVIYQTVVIADHLQQIGNVPQTAPRSCSQCTQDKLQCHHPAVDSSLPVLLSDKVPSIVMAYAAVPSPEFVEDVASGKRSDKDDGLPQATLEQKQVLKQVAAAGSEQEFGCVLM